MRGSCRVDSFLYRRTRYSDLATESMGNKIKTVAGEGVGVVRGAVRQLITVLCLSLLAVMVAVSRLLLNTMLIFAICLLPAGAVCVLICFVLIALILFPNVFLGEFKNQLCDIAGFVLKSLGVIVDYLIVLERMLCSVTTGKYVRQYIYSADTEDFERELYDILLGGIIGASAGAMLGVFCVECGCGTLVLPIISELMHLQHGHTTRSSHSVCPAITGGILGTNLAVQITKVCGQSMSGRVYDPMILHLLGVMCVVTMALICKVTGRDLVYSGFGAATAVVVHWLEDMMEVKHSLVILSSTLVCASIGALNIVMELQWKRGKV